MQSYKMSFQGQLLQRGFWLYVWSIKGDQSHSLYVGRTGDSSSPYASSPFARIGQHLDTRSHAKGNSLARHLRNNGFDGEQCKFEMVAIGPIYPEQKSLEEHRPLRDVTAALESALAKELRSRGYDVLGKHPALRQPNEELLSKVVELIGSNFPSLIK